MISENGYNLTYGGDGSFNHTQETKQKISEAFIGENHPQWGKRGEETPRFGMKHTEETKKKMSKSASGDGNSQYGKRQSKEHIKNRFKHLEHKEHHRSKKYIITFPDGSEKEIISLNRFCKENGLRRTSMLNVASGVYKQHKGYLCRRME